MRKIRLDLDSLSVESFRTAEGEVKSVGTVQGYAATRLSFCVSVYCTFELTCELNCMTNANGLC